MAAGGTVYIYSLAMKNPPRGTFQPSIMVVDRTRGYANRPSVALQYANCGGGGGGRGSFQVITNKHGARVGADGGPDELSQVTILVAGDSQTFGCGVDYENTYAAALARKLDRTVLNIGVPGYGTVAIIRQIQHFLTLGTSPDTVVLGFYYDHAIRNSNRCYPGFAFNCISVPHTKWIPGSSPRFVEPEDNTEAFETLRALNAYISGRDGPFTRWRDFYWGTLLRIAPFLQSSSYLFGRRTPTEAEKAAVTRFLLQTLKRMLDERGIRLVIVYIPNYFVKPVERAPAYLTEAVRQLGITFVDPSDALEAEMKSDPEAIKVPHDGHLNATGQGVLAQAVAPLLTE